MTQTMIQIKDPAAPASPAQTSYLDVLVTQRELPAVCERYALLKGLGAVTKGQASAWIGELLAAPKKTAATPAQAFTAAAQKIAATYAAPAPVDTPQLPEAPVFGYYQVGEALYHWDVTSKDYYPQLRKLYIKTSYTGTKTGSWKKVYVGYTNGLKVTATYQPYGTKKGHTEVTKTVWAPEFLVGSDPLTLDEVGKLGKAYTFCVRCGAQLTDEKSVAAGIGPVCQTYWA